jgi:hypothetical protein
MARNTVCRPLSIFVLAFFFFFLEAFYMKMCVKCPCCSDRILLSSHAADRRITCPKCLTLLKVPAMDELGEALSAIEGTHGGVFVDGKGNCFG